MKMSNLQIVRVIAIALFLSIAVIVVMPATATAAVSVTRELPDAVSPEEEFEVSLTQSGFYMNICGVMETLPDGFEYRGILSGGKFRDYDETTNNLTIDFESGTTTLIYKVKAGTEEQIKIKKAEFLGRWASVDSELNKIYGDIGGDATLEFVKPTPTPTPTPPSGDGNGGGNGGIPSTPPAGTPAYIALSANPADIQADGSSTSMITASVWDGEDWVLENQTVNFITSSGNITASALIENGTTTAILTAGIEEGVATITAEANLGGDIGTITNTTTVNFTTPVATPTPAVNVTLTPTPPVTVSPTPTATPSPTPSPTKKPLIPGFEAGFAIASLLAVAYLVMRRRKA